MERQILHVDVNNAFLSWLAVYKLKNGEKIDIRDQVAVIGGDETRRAGIVLAKSPKAKAIIKYIKNIQINYIICY